MILGVSHIVLGSSSLKEDCPQLERLGYHVDFIESNIPTAPEKSRYMRMESPAQDMAFCTPAKGLAVELIHYGALFDAGMSPWNLIVPGNPIVNEEWQGISKPCWAEVWQLSGRVTLQSAYSTRFQVPWSWDLSLNASCILWEVPDLAAAWRFLQEGFSCKIRCSGQGWICGSLTALVPQWQSDFLLIETANRSSQNCLDGAGFRCLSFLSSNLARDREKILAAGALNSSGMFELQINNKPLLLEMVQAPGGAMIEIMQVLKKER